MDFKEIGINTRNFLDLTQDRDYWRAIVNAALNFWAPISNVEGQVIEST